MYDLKDMVDEFDFFSNEGFYEPNKTDDCFVILYDNFAHLIIMLSDEKTAISLKEFKCSFTQVSRYDESERDNSDDKRFSGIMSYSEAEKFLQFLGYEKNVCNSEQNSVEVEGIRFSHTGGYVEKWVKN